MPFLLVFLGFNIWLELGIAFKPQLPAVGAV